MNYTSPHFASPHPTSPHFAPLCSTLLHFASPHPTLPYFASLCPTSPHFASPHPTSPHFAPLCLTSPNFAPLCLTSPHFTLLCPFQIIDRYCGTEICHKFGKDTSIDIHRIISSTRNSRAVVHSRSIAPRHGAPDINNRTTLISESPRSNKRSSYISTRGQSHNVASRLSAIGSSRASHRHSAATIAPHLQETLPNPMMSPHDFSSRKDPYSRRLPHPISSEPRKQIESMAVQAPGSRPLMSPAERMRRDATIQHPLHHTSPADNQYYRSRRTNFVDATAAASSPVSTRFRDYEIDQQGLTSRHQPHQPHQHHQHQQQEVPASVKRSHSSRGHSDKPLVHKTHRRHAVDTHTPRPEKMRRMATDEHRSSGASGEYQTRRQSAYSARLHSDLCGGMITYNVFIITSNSHHCDYTTFTIHLVCIMVTYYNMSYMLFVYYCRCT